MKAFKPKKKYSAAEKHSLNPLGDNSLDTTSHQLCALSLNIINTSTDRHECNMKSLALNVPLSTPSLLLSVLHFFHPAFTSLLVLFLFYLVCLSLFWFFLFFLLSFTLTSAQAHVNFVRQ